MSGYNENAEQNPTLNPASLSPSSFGCDVQPMGPLQDMFNSIDHIAGTFPPNDRRANQADFTGGIGGPGNGVPFGGVALPPAPDKIGVSTPSNPAPNPTEPY